jgi:DNA polymerase III subunit gamma/tau
LEEIFTLPEQALYLKWRPISFDDMVGQEHITRTLRNSLKTGRVRHAYLFSGPRGTGKTTSARLLAKAINCTNEDVDKRPCNQCPACIAVNEGRYLDLIEIDAATHTGVDDVRDLRDKIAFAPGEGRFKVYIIDEVHRFTGNAFDALLKTLEEPPDHAVFVLATTEIDKVPATIKSRCLPFEFRRVSMNQVADRLQEIAESEGINIEREALELIARQGTGSLRDSISLLDQIVADPAEQITLELTQRILGTASLRAVRELVDAVIEKDITGGLHTINAAIDDGHDPRQFGQQIVEHLRSILLAQTASAELIEASHEDRAMFKQQAGMIERGALIKAIRTFNEAVNEYKGGWQPQLSLELALVESVRGAEEVQAQPQMMMQSQPRQAAPAPAAQAQPEPVATGAPPVIPVDVINNRWTDMLRVLNRLNPTAPALLEHFFAVRGEGNLLYLGTENDIFYGRLQVPEKIQIVERALSEVHKTPLRIKLMIASRNDVGKTSARANVDVNDPLISLGLELGGEIHFDE